jgi:glutamine synthetase
MHGDPITVEDIETLIRRDQIDTVIAAFPDHLGRLMGKRVVGDYFLDRVLTRPLHACSYLLTVDTEMTPLSGFDLTGWEKGYGDFRMVPDFLTLRLATWLEKSAIVICDVQEEGTGNPVAEAPRNILRKQVERAGEKGFEFCTGTELEFYLFDVDYRQARDRRYRGLEAATDYLIDYHILASTYDEPVIRDIRNHLDGSGIPVEFSKGEWGKGQHEINLRYAHPIETADRHVIYKNAAKEIAAAHGKSITYMAKFSSDAAGSSCHIHTSMSKTGDDINLFWDTKNDGPSRLFRWFTGGLLRAEKDLCLLFAPTINSYKRFESASFAPTAVSWAVDNRTVCLRCVGHGGSFRIENRLPGADVNPYVVLAATIGAGLWGIENQIDCGEPYSGDAYGDKDLERVPTTMREAIDVFRRSEMAEEIFGRHVCDYFLHHAELELGSYNRAVTDWELNRYFERI